MSTTGCALPTAFEATAATRVGCSILVLPESVGVDLYPDDMVEWGLLNAERAEVKKVTHDLRETLKREKLVIDWLLDVAGVDGDDRVRLEQCRRLENVTLVTNVGELTLRDQKPLNGAKLERCLADMTVAEWLRTLNGKVFLWPTRERCEQLLNAKAPQCEGVPGSCAHDHRVRHEAPPGTL